MLLAKLLDVLHVVHHLNESFLFPSVRPSVRPSMTAKLPELLDAIIANPDDDDARLVYADALSSQGDPRGEFIVVQMELAHLLGVVTKLDDIIDGLLADADVLRAAKLWRRQWQLLEQHELKWLNETFGDIDFYEHVTFKKGFVDSTVIANDREARLLLHLDEQRTGPPIESLRICQSATDVSLDLLLSTRSTARGSSLLRRLHTLDVDASEITAPAFERLVASTPRLENITVGWARYPVGPHLATACSGSLRSVNVRELSAEVVMRAACMRSIRSLNVRNRPNEFLNVQVCPALEHVELWRGGPGGGDPSDSPFDLAFLNTTTTATLLPRIKTIRLHDDSRVSGDSVGRLIDSPLASTLESLDLSGMGITEKSIEAIGNASRLSTLKELSVAGNVEQQSFVTLARARSARLTKLHVRDVDGLDEMVVASLFATHGSLTNLNLAYSSRSRSWISDLDLLPAFAEHAPPSLRSLVLEGLNLTNVDHLARLLRAPQLSKLRRLSLFRGAMGDSGAGVVAAAVQASMPNLVELNLGANAIRGNGMRAFLNAKERFPAIARLHLGVSGDTASYVALWSELGDEGIFREKAEFLMPSGEPYWTNRDGQIKILLSLGNKPTIYDIAMHLQAIEVGANDDSVVIEKTEGDAVLIKLTGRQYEGVVDPIALKLTCDAGEIRLSYFVSDRHVLWPVIKRITRWLLQSPKIAAPPLRITDGVLQKTIALSSLDDDPDGGQMIEMKATKEE
jgi:uncharacterized protein (TIGR02996 family)